MSLPESEPLPDLLREDPRPALLHGGPLSGGHEDLDGRDRHGGGGIHAVHELSSGSGAGRFGRDSPITDSMDPPWFTPHPPVPRGRNAWFLTLLLLFFFLNCTLRFLRCRCFHLYVFYVVLLGLKKGALGGHTHTHTHLYINQTYTCQRLQKKPFYIAKWRSCSYC